MSLVVNNNMMANSAARHLNTAYGRLGQSTERLSSGLRINDSADDAAGLAVRELMRAEISTLYQGVRNVNDGISLIQTADGALSVIDEKLIRMKELAEQAATGTYTSEQRMMIDSEYQAMASEITRIANATDFNGVHLLNGNLSGTSVTTALTIHFGTGNDSAEDYYTISIGSCTARALGLSGATNEAAFVAENGLTGPTPATYSASAFYSNVPASVSAQFDPSAQINTYVDEDGIMYGILDDTSGETHVITLDSGGGYVDDSGLIEAGGGSSVATQEHAEEALAIIDQAILSKDKLRASLGSLENRLAATSEVLAIQAENLQAAESQISDVDVATEMTEYTKEQIISQAATAMLSQANSLPQMALSLLG